MMGEGGNRGSVTSALNIQHLIKALLCCKMLVSCDPHGFFCIQKLGCGNTLKQTISPVRKNLLETADGPSTSEPSPQFPPYIHQRQTGSLADPRKRIY